MNRQERRQASKIQNDPKVKSYVDKFAKELSSIIVDHFDTASKAMEEGKEIDLNFDVQTKELLSKKGEDLRKFVGDFANQVGRSNHNKSTHNNVRLNIK